MNADKARAIINQAKIEEIYEGPIPEEDEKAVEEAGKLIALAQDAWNQHVRGPEVESILRIANDEFDGSTESEPEEEVFQEVEAEVEDVQEVVVEEPAEEPVEEQSDSQLPWEGYDDQKVSDVIASLEQYASAFEGDDLREFLKTVWEYETAGKGRTTVFNSLNKLAEEIDNEAAEEDAEDELEAPQEKDDVEETVESTPAPEREETIDYKAVIDAVDAELAADTRHAPSPPATEAPELPWDWTKSSDTEIQSLYSYYSLLAYYKSFTLIREDRIALECKRAADELANELLKVSDKYDEKGKEKKVTLLEAEVEADPHVSKWRRLQRKHEAFCASARRERDSLYKLVESLSRFETMRQQEWQRSGQSYK